MKTDAKLTRGCATPKSAHATYTQYEWNNQLVENMVRIGYVVNPNNTNHLAGVCMYPGSGNLPCFPIGHDVQILNDRIRVFTSKLFGEAYSKRSFQDQITVAVFDSVELFVLSCTKLSEFGSSHIPGRFITNHPQECNAKGGA